jgi:hypothetical protein
VPSGIAGIAGIAGSMTLTVDGRAVNQVGKLQAYDR